MLLNMTQNIQQSWLWALLQHFIQLLWIFKYRYIITSTIWLLCLNVFKEIFYTLDLFLLWFLNSKYHATNDWLPKGHRVSNKYTANLDSLGLSIVELEGSKIGIFFCKSKDPSVKSYCFNFLKQCSHETSAALRSDWVSVLLKPI